MVDAALVTAGLVLVVVVLFDAALTTLSFAGSGPLTGRASRLVWRSLRRFAGQGPRRHRVLRWSGTVVLAAIVGIWVAGLWLGWFMVFAAGDATVVDQAGRTADGWSRFYFAGFVIFTLGVGDYTPGTAAAQVAATVAVLTGLFLITLGITYLMQVVSAVVDKRTVAGHVAALGTDPVDILRRYWDGEQFSPMFEQHLTSLTPEVIRLGERHLAFPVVHYFHAESRAKSAPAALTVLDGVVLLLRAGVGPRHRADAGAVEPLSQALQNLARTLGGSFIPSVAEPAGLPDIGDLARAGLPVGEPAGYAAAVAAARDHRRHLHGWCISDGWDDPDLRLTSGTP